MGQKVRWPIASSCNNITSPKPSWKHGAWNYCDHTLLQQPMTTVTNGMLYLLNSTIIMCCSYRHSASSQESTRSKCLWSQKRAAMIFLIEGIRWWVFQCQGCVFSFKCHTVGFIACNTSLQRLLLLISVVWQMHETEMISFVTICKVPQHSACTHFSAIQLVLDNAVLHYPAKCQLPSNMSQLKL
jgi:hypothetical protein